MPIFPNGKLTVEILHEPFEQFLGTGVDVMDERCHSSHVGIGYLRVGSAGGPVQLDLFFQPVGFPPEFFKFYFNILENG